MTRLPVVPAGRPRVFGEFRRSGIGRHLRIWGWLYIRRLRIEDRLGIQVGAGRLGDRDRNARTRRASVGIVHTRAMPASALRETIKTITESRSDADRASGVDRGCGRPFVRTAG